MSMDPWSFCVASPSEMNLGPHHERDPATKATAVQANDDSMKLRLKQTQDRTNGQITKSIPTMVDMLTS